MNKQEQTISFMQGRTAKKFAEICLQNYDHHLALIQCVNTVDYTKIQKVMQFLKWNYFDGEPSFNRLKVSAADLLSSAYSIAINSEIGHGVVASGGFVTEVWHEKDTDDIYASIKFCIEDVSADSENN